MEGFILYAASLYRLGELGEYTAAVPEGKAKGCKLTFTVQSDLCPFLSLSGQQICKKMVNLPVCVCLD